MSSKNTKFYKEEFLKSGIYKNKKDLINTLLIDGELYTKNDVDKIIKKYLEEVI